jgi:hypothetical protein
MLIEFQTSTVDLGTDPSRIKRGQVASRESNEKRKRFQVARKNSLCLGRTSEGDFQLLNSNNGSVKIVGYF